MGQFVLPLNWTKYRPRPRILSIMRQIANRFIGQSVNFWLIGQISPTPDDVELTRVTVTVLS